MRRMMSLRLFGSIACVSMFVGLLACGRWSKKGDDPSADDVEPPVEDPKNPEDPKPEDPKPEDPVPHMATLLGKFPLVGLTYEKNEGDAAKTDADGKLLCEFGEEVHFSLGGLYLGTAACNTYIFATDLSRVKELQHFDTSLVARLLVSFGVPVKDSSNKQVGLDFTLADSILTKLKHDKWVLDIYSFSNFSADVPVVLAAAQAHADAAASDEFQALAVTNNNDFFNEVRDARNIKLAELTAALPAGLKSRLATLSAYAGVVELVATPKSGCVGCVAGYDLYFTFASSEVEANKTIYQAAAKRWKLSADASDVAFLRYSATFITGDSVTLFGTLSAGKTLWITFKDLGSNNVKATGKVLVRNSSHVIQSTQEYDIEVNVDKRPALHIFKTQATFTGNLGGIAGADAKCNADAAKPASAIGTFKAMIMNMAEDRTHNVDWVVASNKGYISMQGGEIVPIFITLFGQHISIPLNNPLSTVAAEAWTGMSSMVTPDADCSGWTDGTNSESGVYGNLESTSGDFFYANTALCDTTRPLICVEQL